MKDKDGGILLLERDIAGKFAAKSCGHRAARHPFLAEWVGIVYNGDEPGVKGEKPAGKELHQKQMPLHFIQKVGRNCEHRPQSL